MTIRRTTISLLGVAVAILGATGCRDGANHAGTTTTAVRPKVTTTQAPAATSVSVYFIRAEKVGPARRPAVAATPARSAVEALLAGPSAADGNAGLTTAIPTGTQLLGLDIASGTATVDLSGSFGSGGGSLSMQERVAQLVYTLTQFPTVQQVSFHIDGKPATSLGGEGLIIDTPQTRAAWESATPAILLESPLPGDTVASPIVINGTANTFEATFQVRLVDAGGSKVYEHYVTATSGTGTRGTFHESIAFRGAAPGPGTLEVFEVSAKDGSEINSVKVPVSL